MRAPQIPSPATDPAYPSHDALHRDVVAARTRGAGHRDEPLTDFRSLLWCAGQASWASTDEEKIEDTLRRATARLGGQTGRAMEALFGLTEETRGRKIRPRRTVAAQLYDHKSYEAFRVHYEPQLLLATTTQISILIANRYLAQHTFGAEWPNFLQEHGIDPNGASADPQALLERFVNFAKRLN